MAYREDVLLDYLKQQPSPVSTRTIAEACILPQHTHRMHALTYFTMDIRQTLLWLAKCGSVQITTTQNQRVSYLWQIAPRRNRINVILANREIIATQQRNLANAKTEKTRKKHEIKNNLRKR